MASNTWNIVLAGECMASRTFSQCEDPDFLKVIDIMREADLTMAHLEMNFGDPEEIRYASRGDWVASFMITEGEIADDFKWAGVDMMSLAHNHSYDWGEDGILATMRHCKRVGITHAGTGRDLEEARKPAYRETRKGRAALISISSGNKQNEIAGQPKATMQGRPGVNPLRVRQRHVVDKETAAALRKIVKELRIGYHRFDAREDEIRLQFHEQHTSRAVPTFVEGDEFKIVSEMFPKDFEGNLRSVEEARSMADMVLVSHHFAIAEGAREYDPPGYVKEFARACIDAGADMYIGHGWHRNLGIEIYKGKPIIYGLGNFFAQSEFNGRVPADSYESWGHDPDEMPKHHPALEPLHPGLVGASWWFTHLFRVQMDGHKVKKIILYPVNLGRDPSNEGEVTRVVGSGDHHPKTDGRPHMANEKDGAVMLGRMQKMCADLGTQMRIENNTGIIEIG